MGQSGKDDRSHTKTLMEAGVTKVEVVAEIRRRNQDLGILFCGR